MRMGADVPVHASQVDAAHVRAVLPEDASGLVNLWRETWTQTYGPSLGPSRLDGLLQGLVDGTGSMLPGRGERGYCLSTGPRIIGSAVVNEPGTTAYLWGMYVNPEHQRAGAGSRLLAHVVQSLGVAKRLEIRALRTSPGAQAFYRAWGFEPIGEEEIELMAGVSVTSSVLAADVAALRASRRLAAAQRSVQPPA